MIAWLWNLIVGQFCCHRWEQIGKCRVIDERGYKIGDDFHLRCTKCGDMKRRRL